MSSRVIWTPWREKKKAKQQRRSEMSNNSFGVECENSKLKITLKMCPLAFFKASRDSVRKQYPFT